MLNKKQHLIIVFYPYEDLFSNATTLLLLERFFADGHEVHLYTKSPPEGMEELSSKISCYQIPHFYPARARRPHIYIKNTILPILHCWKNVFLSLKPKKIIVIDQEGLLVMHRLFPFWVKKINYISFEIFILAELKDQKQKFLKKKEIKILKKNIASLLIQDKYRYELFMNSNKGCNIRSVAYMPVAPRKIDTLLMPDCENVVEIPLGKRSIVYSGSLYKWSGILQILAQLTTNWHPGFHLVVHYRFPEHDHEILKQISNYQKQGYPVTLITKKLVSDQYHQFLKQFNFGFATYIPYTSENHFDGKNFETIGYSSGKFNTLMMLGIPTITTLSSSFKDLKDKYNFGIVINDFTEIKSALNELILNEREMSSQAALLYQDILDPDLYMDQYIKLLN